MERLNKNQGYNIIMDMLEQVGAIGLLEEMASAMSDSELSEWIEHLDDHLFDGHYQSLLKDEPDVFD